MSELKPCPFCGCALEEFPRVLIVERMRILPELVQVQCIRCGASGGTAWSEQEAIEYWNKRKEASK